MEFSFTALVNVGYVLLMCGIALHYYRWAKDRPYAKDYTDNDAPGVWAVLMGILTLIWSANLYDLSSLGNDNFIWRFLGGLLVGVATAIFLNPANVYRVPQGKSAINYLKWSPYGASRFWIDIEGKKSGYKQRVHRPGTHLTLRLFYTPNLGPSITTSMASLTYVRANVGIDKPSGIKYGRYKKVFNWYQSLGRFLRYGGEIGLQGETLPLGQTFYFHWVAFTMVTRDELIGLLPEPELRAKQIRGDKAKPSEIGIEDWRFNLTVISAGDPNDSTKPPMMGIVTCLDGPNNPYGNDVCRLGGYQPFKDLADRRLAEAMADPAQKAELEKTERSHTIRHPLFKGGEQTRQRRDIFRRGLKFELVLCRELMEMFLEPQLDKHDSYQDTEAFYAAGGGSGPQHDVIPPATYRISLFVFSVKVVPQVYADAGDAWTIIGGDGLPAEDITWEWFDYGEIVRPGWKGQFFAFLGRGYHLLNTDFYRVTKWAARLLTFFFNPDKISYHLMDKDPKIFGLVQTISIDGMQPWVNIDVQLKFVEEFLPILAACFQTQTIFAEQFLAPRLNALSVEVMTLTTTLELVKHRDGVADQIFKRIAAKLDEVYVDTDQILIQEIKNLDSFLKVLGDQTIAEQSKETVKAQTALALLEQDRERQKSLAEDQTLLALAQIRKQIADQDKATLQVQAEAIKAFTDTAGTEAGKQLADGLVTANIYAAMARTFDPNVLANVEINKAFAAKGIKMLPEVFAGGDVTQIISALAGIASKKLIPDVTAKTPPTPEPAPEPAKIM